PRVLHCIVALASLADAIFTPSGAESVDLSCARQRRALTSISIELTARLERSKCDHLDLVGARNFSHVFQRLPHVRACPTQVVSATSHMMCLMNINDRKNLSVQKSMLFRLKHGSRSA